MNMINAKDILKIKDSAEILDVREPDEITDLETQTFSNYTLIPKGELDRALKTLSKDKEYYILCRSGRRAKDAAIFMENEGFKVTIIEGGFESIKKELE